MSIDRIKRKHASVWRARVLLPNGQRKSQCFSRKIDAEHWEAKLKSEGLDSPELKRKQTKFESLCEMFLRSAEAELSHATYVKYESAIRLYHRPKFEGLWLEEISRLMIEEFKIDLMRQELSSATKRFVFCALNTLLRKALDWELIAKNPAQAVKPPRGGMSRTEYWQESEARQFLNAMKDGPRFPLYFIALNTGMRLGEILGLQWDCVDFSHGHLMVRRTLDQKTKLVKDTTKTHKSRSIGLSSTLREFLLKLHAARKNEFVLDREDMGCKDVSHAAREFSADCKKAQVRTIRFHDIRHTYATLFVGNGGTIHALSGVLGHTTGAMTSRYAHFTPEHARFAAEVVALDVSDGAVVVSLESAKENRRLSGHRLVTQS